MISEALRIKMDNDDAEASHFLGPVPTPEYRPQTYYKEIINHHYYRLLLTLRHYVELGSHDFFALQKGGRLIDLFLLTSSISSPMGPGSDSEPIPVNYGGLPSFLVDSSQFGFEPIIQSGVDLAYCYMPSMRGEDADERHLNQFFHCEMEMAGDLFSAMNTAEEYIQALVEILILLPKTVGALSDDVKLSVETLNRVKAHLKQGKRFPRITYGSACDLLECLDEARLFIEKKEGGTLITNDGERELLKYVGNGMPVWLLNHPRDLVPFYQKPNNDNTVLNADLLVPALTSNSFGGEILGAGQRQDNVDEMYASLRRQGVDTKDYDWYIDLRRIQHYKMTSGFGLGVERFIAWILCKQNIRDVILYPRIKGIKSNP